MYQNDINLINNANQQPQYTQHITKTRKKLKEQRISPHDLVEFDAESYKEMKNQGLTIDQMKQRTHKQYEKDDLNFDVAFMAPKSENYSKKGVFLPEKNQSYNSLTNNVRYQKNQIQQNQNQNYYGHQPQVGTFVQQKTRVVNSQPQVYSNQSNVRVSVGQPVVTSKVVKRVYKNQYGEVVNVEEQKYF